MKYFIFNYFFHCWCVASLMLISWFPHCYHVYEKNLCMHASALYCIAHARATTRYSRLPWGITGRLDPSVHKWNKPKKKRKNQTFTILGENGVKIFLYVSDTRSKVANWSLLTNGKRPTSTSHHRYFTHCSHATALVGCKTYRVRILCLWGRSF